MESLRRLNQSSEGGGGDSGGGSRKLESGGGVVRRRVERRSATKHITYEHARSKRRADSESSFDESESSHSREDPYVLDEYRVLGKANTDEMNEVCRYFGLSGPDPLGITREDWSANRFQTSHDVIGADSLSSVTQDDPSDFTFVVSPPPSYLAPSAQDSLRDQMERVNDRRVEEGSGNYGVTSPSSLRNDADAAEVGNTSNRRREEEQERVQECQSNRSPIGWRARSTSMPTCQNRSFSPAPTSLVFLGTQLLGNKIFEDHDPVTHIQRALSEPVVLPSDVNPRSIDVHVLGEVKLKRGSILGSNNGSLQKSDLTKSHVPVEEERDLRPRDDENGVHPLITFPWNKGCLVQDHLELCTRHLTVTIYVKGTCKLAYFGLAKQISALDQLKSCKGSAYWMAPEVIDPKKTNSLPADIWSLGCSVLEMFTGSPPFGDQEWYRVLWKVGHGEAPPIPDDLSDDAKDFIRQCLEVNPLKRPTATALLQHRFLSTSSTPTNSGHLYPQLVVSSLHTITEERTASSTKWRSDLTGLGVRDFHDVFNPRQIVCIYTNRVVPENAIEMVFLHVEGMALFIGVGLPHSLVLLQRDGIVKVKEIQKSTWSELWMETKINEYKLILLDSASWSNAYGTCQPEVSERQEILSTEEAAEQLGVGVEGMNFYKYGGLHRDPTQDTPRLPYWMTTFYELLTRKDHAGKNTSQGNSEVVIMKEKVTDSLIWDFDAKLPDLSHDEYISEQNGGATSVDHGPAEKQDQPLQLTVIVYLDHSKCQYFSPSDRIQLQVTEQTDSGLSSLTDPNSREALENIRDASTDFELTPTVTITFLYCVNVEREGSKKLTTNLDVRYFLDSDIEDQKAFGWYHDKLRLSFICKQPNKVYRGKPGQDELRSQNEYRSADLGRSEENSTLSLRGKVRELKIFGGHRTFGSLEYISTSRKETTECSSSKRDSGTKITKLCLMQNFAIRDVGRQSELAYEATIFPPLQLFSLWNPIDRCFLHPTGIMSPVPIHVEGRWIVRDDPINANVIPSTEDIRRGFCEYELSCQRNLMRHEQKEIEIPTKKTRFPSIKGRDRDETMTEVCVDTVLIQQVLRKVFLINHSFSHMQGLKKPNPYEWNMVGQPDAPCPEPADQLIS